MSLSINRLNVGGRDTELDYFEMLKKKHECLKVSGKEFMKNTSLGRRNMCEIGFYGEIYFIFKIETDKKGTSNRVVRIVK